METQRTTLTIVRHGQTPANIDGLWHGSTNTPLTALGLRQAESAADWIQTHHQPVAGLYASPLDRAHHTALAISRRIGLQPEIDPDLAEYDLGEWEGMHFQALLEEKKLFHNMRADPDYRPHGGESPRQVGDRLASALRRIADRHPGERAVVVSHGGALSIAFGLLIDGDYGSWGRMMKNCAISELVLEPRAELIRFNHTDHLPGEA
ncbi:MAG: histidine phosphatase family protein [Deltaproteobacteria bacterium]|jgi:broad specificity phosphatase PhoE|nr:histidine phosphatase family protein [Deltaproteobacteria bacterium]MBW2495706.1 histidine phosphatase family protein [Deltaproteobacteria bacterium]